MIDVGSRPRRIGAALAALAIGLVLGAVVWGIYSTRALSADVRTDIRRNSSIIDGISQQNTRIEALELELKQLLNAQPGLNRRLTADIIAQIEALKFTVRQEGGRVIVVPQRVVVTTTVTPSPAPPCTLHPIRKCP